MTDHRAHNAHTRQRELAPRHQGGTFLPIDTPPRMDWLPAELQRGLSWEFDPGTMASPVPRPFTQYSSELFPNSHPSNVAPAAVFPRYGYSVNEYSPVPHRRGGELMERNPAKPVVRLSYAGTGRTRLGRSSGRIRAAVTPYPPVNPAWRSLFGNAMITPGGSA